MKRPLHLTIACFGLAGPLALPGRVRPKGPRKRPLPPRPMNEIVERGLVRPAVGPSA
ncbi:MAG TPA: hypothetical protein VMV94_06340 [Phycisphaerae bacterium]|nr:hypothetical protein [Phycisphaerae bacterium]